MNLEKTLVMGQAFPHDIFKLLTFSVFNAFFGVKFSFICLIHLNNTDLRCLLDIKELTKPAKGAGALAAYWSALAQNSRIWLCVNGWNSTRDY